MSVLPSVLSPAIKQQPAVRAVFVVPPGVHLMDISGPAHIIYEAAASGAPITLRFVSVHPEITEAQSTSGLAFARLENYRSITLGPGDTLFIPGLVSGCLTDGVFFKSIHPFLIWLEQQHQQGARLCSICTGAFFLAEAGLLNDLPCTTHWKFADLLESQYPRLEVLRNRLFVQHHRISTSAGIASGIDLALYLLEQDYGTAFASAIAREVVVYMRRGQGDPQLSIFLQYRNHLEDRVHAVQEWLVNNFHRKHTVHDLAAVANTSPRNLTRLFKETTGITIGQYTEKLRVERAVQLLREQVKISTIASTCGLQSANHLRDLLKKHTGVLPSKYAL